jgi:hypothetical protein
MMNNLLQKGIPGRYKTATFRACSCGVAEETKSFSFGVFL